MNKINELLKELSQLETALDKLSHEYASNYVEYSGDDFAEQNNLACNLLDNLILAATHETASQIGFYRESIKCLTQFIDFRKNYSQFTDAELSLLIDDELINATKKLELQKKITAETSFTQLSIDWNHLFQNHSYSKIKQKLKLV
jgi:hypothetical protein